MTTGKTFKNVIAGMALVAACACAASVDVVVTNSYELTLGTGRTVSPATSWAATDVLPDVGTPIFRFDCTQTNGWGLSSAWTMRDISSWNTEVNYGEICRKTHRSQALRLLG